jgi:hypothetical protein
MMAKQTPLVERSGETYLASIGPKGILFYLEEDGWVGGVMPTGSIYKMCNVQDPWEDVPEADWTDRVRAMIRRVEVEDVPESFRRC